MDRTRSMSCFSGIRPMKQRTRCTSSCSSSSRRRTRRRHPAGATLPSRYPRLIRMIRLRRNTSTIRRWSSPTIRSKMAAAAISRSAGSVILRSIRILPRPGRRFNSRRPGHGIRLRVRSGIFRCMANLRPSKRQSPAFRILKCGVPWPVSTWVSTSAEVLPPAPAANIRFTTSIAPSTTETRMLRTARSSCCRASRSTMRQARVMWRITGRPTRIMMI